MVTSAGLRAWSKRVKAEARRGERGDTEVAPQGNISLYMACHGKGPQQKWLHKMGKEEALWCHCLQGQQSRRHIVEECPKLTELKRELEKGEDEMVEWRTRHSPSGKQRDKGEMGVEKEKEKLEGERMEKMELLFGAVHSLLSDFERFDVTNFLSPIASLLFSSS